MGRCSSRPTITKSGYGLWKSDGTTVGTVKFTDFLPDTHERLTHIGQTIYFSRGTLWKSDGTPQGTAQVSNVENVSQLTAVGETLFFISRAAAGPELWKSDGTPAGTVPVVGPRPDWAAMWLEIAREHRRHALFSYRPGYRQHIPVPAVEKRRHRRRNGPGYIQPVWRTTLDGRYQWHVPLRGIHAGARERALAK